jgi:hypothetical protein
VATKLEAMAGAVTREPITANADEQDALREIEKILTKANQEQDAQSHPMFLDADGEKIELPSRFSVCSARTSPIF